MKFKLLLSLALVIGAASSQAREYVVSIPWSAHSTKFEVLNLSEEKVRKLSDRGLTVEENNKFYLQPASVASVEFSGFAGTLSTVVWPLETIHGDKAHELPQGNGEGVSVCLVDTGVDKSNPYLQGVILGGRNFIDDTRPEDFSDSGPIPLGTWVAMLIAGQRLSPLKDSFVGVAPGAKLWIAKAYDEKSGATMASVAKALIYCGERSTVINISLGSYVESPMLHGIIEELKSKGISIFAPAGNGSGRSPKGTMSYPGSDPMVIGVGSVNAAATLSQFSPIDERLDVVAPGEGIPIPGLTGDIGLYTGTSFSSAIVAGVEAIRQSRKTNQLKFQNLNLPRSQQGQGLIDALLTATDF